MCEFHDCNCNGLGDIWWTDKCMNFSSIDDIFPIFYIISCFYLLYNKVILTVANKDPGFNVCNNAAYK